MRKSLTYTLTIAAVAAMGISNAFGQSSFEGDSPSFNAIPLQLLRDSVVTRWLGDDSNRIHVYVGEFVTADENIYLTGANETSDNIFTTVAGASATFEGAAAYSLKLAGQYRYLTYDDNDNEDTPPTRSIPK